MRPIGYRATSPRAVLTASSSELHAATNCSSIPQVGKGAQAFHDFSRNQSETSCSTQLKHANSSVGSATRADSFSST